MLQNQLARRNLSDFQRVEMVRKCEQAVKAQAKQRMLAGKTDPSPKLGKGRATDELGELAGVSRKTYEHAAAVLDHAPAPVVDATRNSELSINAAYEVTKLPHEQQHNVADRISLGEKPRSVIADVPRKKTTFWDKLIPNTEKTARNGQNVDTVIQLLQQALPILQNFVSDKL